MGRLVVFSASNFCLAFVAMAGLPAYTAAYPLDARLVAVSTSASPSRPIRARQPSVGSAPRWARAIPEGRRMSGSGSVRVSVFRSDRPRQIDRYIDFFGGAVPLLAGLPAARCAGLTQIADQGEHAVTPAKPWVFLSNLPYTGEGSERQNVWVLEDEIRTNVSSMLFGKTAVIAPLHVVPRYAPPPGGGVIRPLQGGRP
jgi:hypothetical protein